MPTVIYNSFAGGMNASGNNPRLTPVDCCPLIVNGTVRGGFIDSRPSFVRCPMSWLDGTAQQVVEHGIYQGSAFYNAERGPMMLYAFDGHIVSYDILTGNTRCLTRKKRAFSKNSQFVFFGQRGPYAVAQDGVSPPLIIRGLLATQGTKATSVPCGTMMTDGWGRFFVVSPDRTRIYASNHEADPTSDSVLSFSEGTAYYKNARYFQIPANLGPVMGLEFSPSFTQQSDLGALTAFCQFGSRAFNVFVPRDQWTTQDIATTPMPTTGACAHGAIVRRGKDMVFSDQHGHITSLVASIRRDDFARLRMADESMYPVYRDEFSALRRWRQAVRFNDRTMTTVLPFRAQRDDGRWTVAHKALAVQQETPQQGSQEIVWDGLWTGLGFASLDTATVNGQQRCFTVSLDADGVNRIYEITGLTTGFDVGSRATPIERFIQLRSNDFDAAFATKKFEGAAYRLGDVSGTVNVNGWWSKDRKNFVPWFSSQTSVVSAGDCDQAVPSQHLPRENPPSPPKGQDVFFELATAFTITGAARLEEVSFKTGDPLPVPEKMNTGSSCQPKNVPADTTCQPNPFNYAVAP